MPVSLHPDDVVASPGRRAATAVGIGSVGLVVCWVVVRLTGLLADPGPGVVPTETTTWRAVVVGAILAATATPSLVRLAWRRMPHEVLVLATASALLSGAALAALHGTSWGMDGLYSDSGFRTQAVTRFASSPALADYTYQGLAAYYPPLLPWLQGRAADLLGVAGWQVMKPTQVLAGLVLAPLGWLLWRRVLPVRTAAWVAGAVAVLVATPNKPDQWLVLCLLLPWWLEVCRGLRRPDVAPAGVVRHGLVLGVLLLSHTYFFVPFALATAVGMLLDLLARRPVTPRLPGAVAIGAIGVLVATPTWWAMAVARVTGLPSDDLQRRWSPLGFDWPPHPLPIDPRGVLEALAVVWLVVAVRRSKLAGELLLVLVTAYVFMVGGQLLQPWGVAVLPEKAADLIEAVYAAAGVLAVRAGWRAWQRRTTPSPPARRSAVVVLAVLGLLVSGQSVGRGMLDPARPAQSMRYPDGTFPAGGPVPAGRTWHPWDVQPRDPGPSVEEVDVAWQRLTGRPLGPDDLLLSTRADVLATIPVHSFVAWKSIYSHPNGQYERRLAHLRELERCGDPECAWRLLRDDELDAVDGLVLAVDRDGPYLRLTEDNFPEGWIGIRVGVPEAALQAPWFRTEVVDGVVVAAVQPDP